MSTAAPPIGHAGSPSAPHAAHAEHGPFAWIATVDHKRIGILYLVTALFFFSVGGIEALVIRLQLARPNATLVTAEAYNQLFTMHGTTMIFLVVMPALSGFANYLVPLMIGARDMAFPRLNAMSYWLLPFGGALLHFSVMTGGAPAGGWFSYAPLTETPFSSTPGTDYWILALLVLGIGSVATAINLIATVLTLRAPGMTMGRVPLFVWMTFVTSILVILAIPVLNAAIVLLFVDRQLDAHVFLASGGGNTLLWQHFFWTFGHPEVYILALPAFGMISEIIPVFSRKPIFGRAFVAASAVAIAILSFGVWAHHMFAVGLGRAADLFFVMGSMLIAVPTGVKIFNWIATMWGGSIRFTTAMLFAAAFLIEFVVGGLSGITFAVAPIDWQMTDTYYVVAHFHYVIFGGTAFALLGAVYYWFPKISGRLLSESLGKWNFWLMVLGFNLTFFVQHFLGVLGMPRRVYTYPDLPYWGALNMISTVGAFLMGLASLLLVVNVAWSLRRGKVAGDNPWDAWTLEWLTTSPPPHDNFAEVPAITGTRPLYDLARARAGAGAGAERVLDKGAVAVWTFIASETGFFLILILAYVFFDVTGTKSGPRAASVLDVTKTGAFTACLFASSFTLWLSERAEHRKDHAGVARWLAVTILLGGVFLVGQGSEYLGLFQRGMGVATNLFATTFFTLTGFHGLHVTVGLFALMIVFGLARGGDFRRRPSSLLRAVGLYWHFVDVVWLFVFSIVYLRAHV
ncbi:MAG TPA: cytochrome c oxidase subunit I [Polyangiaceae bacterium]|jgi:cytochrome c oxidase subunit 1/cytochrome c oxidase subunit I+III